MHPRRMLIGIVVGGGLGLAANALGAGQPWVAWTVENVAQPIGQVFLRLLFMLVIPLLISALVCGISGIELRDLGRLGARTLVYTVVVSLMAALLGLLLVNVLRPGEGAGAETLRTLARGAKGIAAAPAPTGDSPVAMIVNMIPDNFVKAAAAGDMLGVIVFALVLAISLALTRTEAAGYLRNVLQGLYDVMMTAIGGVMRLAPLGVGALLFSTAARLGTDLLSALGAYVAVVLLGLAIHCFVVYSILIKVLSGRSPLWFFRGARLAMVTAFSTASSTATLPTALKTAEETLGLPRSVSRFVLTVGATMNQNGTALFEGVTVLFLAQLYGVPLSLGQQGLVMAVSVLAGVGTAGVPAASLPVLAMILAMLGIPAEGIGLILGVDRLLDMCRTTLNVTGDLVAAVCLSGRGELSPATDVSPPAGVDRTG